MKQLIIFKIYLFFILFPNSESPISKGDPSETKKRPQPLPKVRRQPVEELTGIPLVETMVPVQLSPSNIYESNLGLSSSELQAKSQIGKSSAPLPQFRRKRQVKLNENPLPVVMANVPDPQSNIYGSNPELISSQFPINPSMPFMVEPEIPVIYDPSPPLIPRRQSPSRLSPTHQTRAYKPPPSPPTSLVEPAEGLYAEVTSFKSSRSQPKLLSGDNPHAVYASIDHTGSLSAPEEEEELYMEARVNDPRLKVASVSSPLRRESDNLVTVQGMDISRDVYQVIDPDILNFLRETCSSVDRSGKFQFEGRKVCQEREAQYVSTRGRMTKDQINECSLCYIAKKGLDYLRIIYSVQIKPKSYHEKFIKMFLSETPLVASIKFLCQSLDKLYPHVSPYDLCISKAVVVFRQNQLKDITLQAMQDWNVKLEYVQPDENSQVKIGYLNEYIDIPQLESSL